MSFPISPIICLFCLLQAAFAQDIKLSFPGHPTTVQGYVYDVAFISRIPGSLVVSGTCTDEKGVIAVLKNPPSGPFSNLDSAFAALRQVDPYLHWSRDRDGRFRIVDSRTPRDILEVHIHHLSIRDAPGIDGAISQLMDAPEIKEALSRNFIEHGIIKPGMIGNSKHLPHLNLQAHDISLKDALDQITTFYPGVWMYCECQNGHTRRITVQGLPIGSPKR